MMYCNDLYVKTSLADYDRIAARAHLLAEARRSVARPATRHTSVAKARYALATLVRIARRHREAPVATIQPRHGA